MQVEVLVKERRSSRRCSLKREVRVAAWPGASRKLSTERWRDPLVKGRAAASEKLNLKKIQEQRRAKR